MSNKPAPDSPLPDPGTPDTLRGHDAARKAMIGLAAAVLVGGGAAVGAYYWSEADAWVGTVNGQRITREHFDRDVAMRKRQYQMRLNVDFEGPSGKQMLDSIHKEVIDQHVERQILLAEAQTRKLGAQDPEVETRVRAVAGSFPNAEAFSKALQDNGVTKDGLAEQVRTGLIIEKLRDEVTRGATVSAAEIREHYDKNPAQFEAPEEVKASHILVKTEAEARDVVAKVKAGADFGDLARERSEDAGSKPQGGDLGFFGRGRMVPEFEQAAFTLDTGKVSAPVKSQFGWHVIKVVDRHAASKKTFDQVREDLADQLLKQKRDAAFRAWIQERRESARIVIRPQYQAAAPPPVPAGAASAPAPLPAHKTP